jgi:cysteine sulfinate desulfinase/cysteine desulfurase-like protein
MGLEEHEVRASLRFSLGTSTTEAEINLVGEVIAGVVAQVRAAHKGAK